jgi:hypothetical protein
MGENTLRAAAAFKVIKLGMRCADRTLGVHVSRLRKNVANLTQGEYQKLI